MPALTHGRVPNGYNGPSNPNKNSKVYKTSINYKADATRVNALPGGVGTSRITKRAWQRRAITSEVKCCDLKN